MRDPKEVCVFVRPRDELDTDQKSITDVGNRVPTRSAHGRFGPVRMVRGTFGPALSANYRLLAAERSNPSDLPVSTIHSAETDERCIGNTDTSGWSVCRRISHASLSHGRDSHLPMTNDTLGGECPMFATGRFAPMRILRRPRLQNEPETRPSRSWYTPFTK